MPSTIQTRTVVGKAKMSEKETPITSESNKNMNDRKPSWEKFGRVDSLNLEAGRTASTKSHASKVPLYSSIFLSSLIVFYSSHFIERSSLIESSHKLSHLLKTRITKRLQNPKPTKHFDTFPVIIFLF